MKVLITAFFLLSLLAFTARSQSVEDYIQTHVPTATQLMREKNVPASLILGVAIHESAAGKSKIARFLNNHFGIKGKNSNTVIRSAYRDYPSADASFFHFTDYLSSKSAYTSLFEKLSPTDYKGWARGIQRGGYAASRSWASQVVALIDKYKLYQYDESGNPQTVYPAQVASELIAEITPIPLTARVYIVKKKDNLTLIARKLGTTVSFLRAENDLRTIILQPGQELKY